MNKIFILSMLFITTLSIGQELNKGKISYYASAGLSISNTSVLDDNGNKLGFENASYPSLEMGVSKNNISLGVVIGRGNLSEFNNDKIQNYWYELKTAISQPIGVVNGYVLFGIGNYIDVEHIFIEYGAGINYSPTKVGYFVQASNWDGIWYVTPGISYNFN